MACIAATHPSGLWGCDCTECIALQMDAQEDSTESFCSVCDASPDHGPRGCPLENRAWDDGFDDWEAARGV